MDKLFPARNPYLEDPAAWMEDRLGFIWSMQADIADSVCDNRHTAVASCHGPGKSWLAGGIVAWWMDVHPIGEAFAVTTAPSQTQIKTILWREIGRHHRRADLWGYITGSQLPEWKTDGGEIAAFGRKPQDYTDPEQAKAAFQGIHARFVLVVLDEAAGIPIWLWDAIEGLVTNDNARILAIGNPDDPASKFAKVCAPGSGWNVFHIDAFETPNFTGEYVPPELAEMLTSPTWVEERRKRWGVKSPLYQSRVRGRFPKVGTDQLIQPEWILNAQKRDLSHTAIDNGRYGVDVARSGVDESVIMRKRGYQYRVIKAMQGIGDTMVLAGHINKLISPHLGQVAAVIDTIGIGAGVFDRCSEMDLNVIDFNASEQANDPTEYINKRAEQYWFVRELFKDGLVDIDEDDDELASQLGSMKWKVDSSGRIKIESKEEMAKRGLPSPDRADALMYSTVEEFGLSLPRSSQEHNQSETGDLLEIDW